MKALYLKTIYPEYLTRFYNARPGLAARTYREQLTALSEDAFSAEGAWEKALKPHGIEMVELIANCEPMQLAWSRETATRWENPWIQRMATARILHERPDILFMGDYSQFTASWLKELKEACPSIRFVVGWCGSPYSDPTVFSQWDLVLSCVPELVSHFREQGHRSEQLHHAFDPRILNRIDLATEADHDFVFVGNIIREAQFHSTRERLLGQLIERTPLEIFSLGGSETPRELARAYLKRGLFALGLLANRKAPPPLPLPRRFRRAVRPPVYGLPMFELIRRSRVVLNCHIDISPRFASNQRLFEVTGVGSCLLTDWKENLSELFTVGDEIECYRSVEECVEKARWLLDHPKERREIAARAQARVLRDHTYERRAERLAKIFAAGVARG